MLMVALCFSSSLGIAAKECNVDPLRIDEVCGGLPYHDMRSRGFGTVILSDGSTYLLSQSCWQCSNCDLVMVTEGDITLGQMGVIGKYAIKNWQGDINYGGCIMNNPDFYGYCGTNSLSGYKFGL